jgi:hypothetical protein
MSTSCWNNKLSVICGVATVGAVASLGIFEAGAAHAFNFTQSQTRTETDLFGGNSTFPNNTFSFEIPQLVSNIIDFTISWEDLDADGFDGFLSFRDEDFDVSFTDQQGNSFAIFNEIGSNIAGGSIFNSDGTYNTQLNLPSLAGGTLDFIVGVDGFFGNGVEPFPPEGSMTVAVSGHAVPTPALLPGLIGMGAAALRKKRTEAVEEA